MAQAPRHPAHLMAMVAAAGSSLVVALPHGLAGAGRTALGTVMADAVIVTVPTPLIAAQGRSSQDCDDKARPAITRCGDNFLREALGKHFGFRLAYNSPGNQDQRHGLQLSELPAGGTGAAYGLAHHLIHAFPDKFQWLQSLSFAIDADASHNHRVEDYSSKIGGIEETWIR